MIISPPILKTAQGNRSDEAWLNELMPNPSTGGFPVTQMLAWHGGMHIANAGATESVRAIADGTVVYVRPPSPPAAETEPPLNYDGRTSDGCIVIRHDTEIGEGPNGLITFYSICMHLNTIYSEKLRTEVRESTVNGRRERESVNIFVKEGSKVYRKDKLGTVGYCGNDVEMHFEIICNEENLQKIVGRTHNDLNEFIQRDGRTDAVYGDMHFYIPAATQCYSPNPITTPLASALPNGIPDLIVTMRFEKGQTILTTRQADPQKAGYYPTIGASDPENDSEYNLYEKAKSLANGSNGIAASAIYELLRFGRVINVANDAPIAAGSVKNWRKINLPNGQGWVDLNAVNIKKYSDADFPPWSGWILIGDDAAANNLVKTDSQCNASIIKSWMDTDNDENIKAAELQQALANEENKKRLAKAICKFPTEWAKNSIEDRYKWTMTKSDLLETPLNDSEYKKLEKHINKLSFWEEARARSLANAKLDIEDNHWHFNPREFIQHFRKCGWLSKGEWLQTIPKTVKKLHGTSFINETISNNDIVGERLNKFSSSLNKIFRKYRIDTPLRRVMFCSNVWEETGYLRLMVEGRGASAIYAPWYGRGLIQLTHLENYKMYGKYRNYTSTLTSGIYAELGWDPDLKILNSDFNCIDTAVYWVNKSATALGKNLLIEADEGYSVNTLVQTAKGTNGNVPIKNINGLDSRLQMSVFLKYVILDTVKEQNVTTESVTFKWRKSSERTGVTMVNGREKRIYEDGEHTINVDLIFRGLV